MSGGPILFDLNGTLTDPSPIGEPWDEPELGREVIDAAVAAALVDTITGVFRPFKELVHGAIEHRVALHGLDPSHVEAAAAASAQLPLWPDAADALDALRATGRRLAVLTNSGSEAGRATLEEAGVADRFDLILGVDEVRAYKPDRRTYEHALRELASDAGETTLVAAHWWDVTGARRAGLLTAWVARGETHLHPAAEAPDMTAADLRDAARLVALV